MDETINVDDELAELARREDLPGSYPAMAERWFSPLADWLCARRAAADGCLLVGLNGAGHWVAAARAQAGEAVDRAVVDTAGFRFANLTAFDDPAFLPGGAKYLDLPGILALSAPGELWLAGEGADAPAVVAAAYRAAGSPEKLTVFDGEPSRRQSAALAWLMR